MKLSEQVAALERENERLQNMVDSLTEQLEAKSAFVRLMSPYMAVVLGKEDVLTQEFSRLAKSYREAMDD